MKIGLELRRQLFLDCHQVLLDTLIRHAEDMEEIEDYQVGSFVTSKSCCIIILFAQG